MKQRSIFRRYRPMYLRSTRFGKGKIAVLAAAVCLLSVISAGTLAHLIDRDSKINTFIPAMVDCHVHETFTNNIKSNVTVENTGNTDAYIRAFVVVNWVGDDGTENAGKIAPELPMLGTDYTISYGTGWVQYEGLWHYYTQSVPAAGSTTNLIDSCSVMRAGPEGYHLEVEIVAEAVQAKGTAADGKKPVVIAWGVDPENLTKEATT